MKIITIETPNFKVDAGAMFGPLPKSEWNKTYTCDCNNICTLSCRSLLIDFGTRIFLVDTGMGEDIQNPVVESYSVDYTQNLIQNLELNSYRATDITDIIITHLHLDHCGGNINIDKKNAFPNAVYHISKLQWQSANNPSAIEKDSFVTDFFSFLADSSTLNLIDEKCLLCSDIELKIFNGHTSGLMLPIINANGQKIFFAGDLFPTQEAFNLPCISKFDVFPLITFKEKQKMLTQIVNEKMLVVLQHDNNVKVCKLNQTGNINFAIDCKTNFCLEC